MASKSPSISVERLHHISEKDALALVDQELGPPSSWPSELVRYRLTEDFQKDWKIELGQWLATGRKFDFLGQLTSQLVGMRDGQRAHPGFDAKDPNDQHHLKIHQQLASALFCHYFTGTGWGYQGWETSTTQDKASGIDIDLALGSPTGSLVEFQIKAPGELQVFRNGRYVKSNPKIQGTPDGRLVEDLDTAAGQLPNPSRSVGMLAVFSQRDRHLAFNPECVTRHVYGRGTSLCGVPGVYMDTPNFGRFLAGKWNHVSGIVILDLVRTSDFVFDEGQRVRAIDDTRYACTVLLNPRADHPADPTWFPHARVLVVEGDTFRWVRGAPSDQHFVPDGTKVVPVLPDFPAEVLSGQV